MQRRRVGGYSPFFSFSKHQAGTYQGGGGGVLGAKTPFINLFIHLKKKNWGGGLHKEEKQYPPSPPLQNPLSVPWAHITAIFVKAVSVTFTSSIHFNYINIMNSRFYHNQRLRFLFSYSMGSKLRGNIKDATIM